MQELCLNFHLNMICFALNGQEEREKHAIRNGSLMQIKSGATLFAPLFVNNYFKNSDFTELQLGKIFAGKRFNAAFVKDFIYGICIGSLQNHVSLVSLH